MEAKSGALKGRAAGREGNVLSAFARSCAVEPRRLERLRELDRLYPSLATERYLSLVDWSRPEGDPILAQCLPDERELEPCSLAEDGLGELPQSPLPRLVRRYPDRALLLTTDSCFVRCRFCFRRRLWRSGAARTGAIGAQELDEACAYLKANPQVKDLLLSGGDPLTMDDEALGAIIEKVLATGSVETIRVCTRAPAVEPSRFTESLAKTLGSFPGVWLMAHFNHPRELDAEAVEACRKIVSHGTPMLNQTVLLKGVNDDAQTLMELFRALAKARVRPHYLFHADPVAGAAHFATGVENGLALMRAFRKGLSSIATPCFAIDLPEGGGKVPLQPDYSDGGLYEAIDGRKLRHPLA